MRKLLLLLFIIPTICFPRSLVVRNNTDSAIDVSIEKSNIATCITLPSQLGWFTVPPHNQKQMEIRIYGCGTREPLADEFTVYGVDSIEPSKDQFLYEGRYTNKEPSEMPNWRFFNNSNNDIARYFRYYICKLSIQKTPDWNIEITPEVMIITPSKK